MPRPKKCRRICALPRYSSFGPLEGEAGGPVEMALEEYEAIRLMDLLGCTQEECAGQMGVARSTVQQVYDQARGKLALALVEGRRLVISGGDYLLCGQAEECAGWDCARRDCGRRRCGCGSCTRRKNGGNEHETCGNL
ncbi:DUF134 domain-containing protein [uncultured Flavonifractor sp.]|uniref:DUF134 domain-containing protein n=1 Tax=uncultured Flavonifractor sp. TaxID=1193534 RepID=UPI002607BC29|nr:DUF134 domain-containing protein [uncultured Flavonifractor sp.]